jgi:hypothetical protein
MADVEGTCAAKERESEEETVEWEESRNHSGRGKDAERCVHGSVHEMLQGPSAGNANDGEEDV